MFSWLGIVWRIQELFCCNSAFVRMRCRYEGWSFRVGFYLYHRVTPTSSGQTQPGMVVWTNSNWLSFINQLVMQFFLHILFASPKAHLLALLPISLPSHSFLNFKWMKKKRKIRARPTHVGKSYPCGQILLFFSLLTFITWWHHFF